MTINASRLAQLVDDQPPPAAVEFDYAWRWRRMMDLAKEFSEFPLTLKSRDPAMYETWQFIRRYYGFGARPDRGQQTRAMFTTVFDAHELHFNPNGQEARWLLEALIIGGMDTDKIAEHVPATVDTIRRYEHLFFDARTVVKYRPWFMDHLLKPAMKGRTFGDQDVYRKMIAFLGGAEMLLKYLDPAAFFTEKDWEWVGNMIRKNVARNAFDAGMLAQPNQYNAIKCQDFYHRYVEEGVNDPRRMPGGAARNNGNGSEAEELSSAFIDGLRALFDDQPVKVAVEGTDDMGTLREEGISAKKENKLIRIAG